MQHTNSQRGPDGRFGGSDAPKARRVDVWLQPQTIELLDELTKQWGVGRGKVIDQLICRGPVAPKTWESATKTSTPTTVDRKPSKAPSNGLPKGLVRMDDRIDDPSDPAPVAVETPPREEPQKPEPTASGPPEPVSKAPAMDFVTDWGVLPSNASKRQWIAIEIALNPELTKTQNCWPENQLEDQKRRTIAALSKEGVTIGIASNSSTARVRFLMNVETAEPFTAGYPIPPIAIGPAQKYVREVYPKPEPAPTTGGRSTLFDDPEYIAMQEKMSRQWDICKADAKAVPGATAKRVQTFKARHKIGPDTPLSPDAQQLLRDEMENDGRSKAGNERAIETRLGEIRKRLNESRPGLAQSICDQCETVEVDRYVATDYLLRLLPDVGVKPYKKLCQGLWDSLPQMEHVNLLALDLSEVPARRALFWGVILRLDQLEGEPPTAGGPFLEWCHLQTYKKHNSRLDSGRFGLGDLFAGQMSENDARGVLKLPQGVELTSKAISDTFKSLAKKAHPDMGGTAEQMNRLSKAKKRLLLTVAA